MTLRSPSTRTAVIKWARRHGALDADLYDSLDEAVSAAHSASGYGEEAFECIEVIRPDGREILGRDQLSDLFRPLDEAEAAAYSAGPPVVAVIRLTDPSGRDSATYEGFSSVEEAEREAEQFRQLLGPGRVRVEPVR